MTTRRRWTNATPTLIQRIVCTGQAHICRSTDIVYQLNTEKVKMYLFTWYSALVLTVCGAEQTREVDPMLAHCWADVVDGGPTENQHWVRFSRL